MFIHPVHAKHKTSSNKARERKKIVMKAKSKVGSRYVYGAAHSYSALRNKRQRKFDCSGFVSWVYHQSGYSIGIRTSSSMRRVGRHVSKSHLKKGDILIFPHHVAIYIGNNKIVHAQNRRTGVVTSRYKGHWSSRTKMVRRVIN